MNKKKYYYFRIPFEKETEHYSFALLAILEEKFAGYFSHESEKQGIYLATSNAGVNESISFWKKALEKTPAFANPANFPWTLSNAPASFLAKMLKIKGPVYTLVGMQDAWVGCLLNAESDLKSCIVDAAWVIGLDLLDDALCISIYVSEKSDEINKMIAVASTLKENFPSACLNKLINPNEVVVI